MTKLKKSVIAIALMASLSGCANSWYPFVYHPEIHQGNVVNPNAVAMLKPGMSKAQVRSLMGDPVLDTPLSSDTWHYIDTVHKGSKVLRHQQVTLYFRGDSLVQIS